MIPKIKQALAIAILLLLSCGAMEREQPHTKRDFPLKQSQSKEALRLLSWNIKDLGQSKSDEQIEFMAQLCRDFDLLAIQEVVAGNGGAQAVARLADELNRKGAKWDYAISDPTPSPPYKTERYAFLWKTHKVERVGRPWLWTKYKNTIYRSPYLGRFKHKESGKSFLVVNYHSRRYDENPGEEIEKLRFLPQEFPNENIIIAGDFNIVYGDAQYEPLLESGFVPSIHDQKTTLKKKPSYSGETLYKAIDNVFYQPKNCTLHASGVIDFSSKCPSLEEANRISDHVPVVVEISFK